jgi:hypothetical protein
MADAEEFNAAQPDGWDEGDWEGLLHAIRFKRCTPFLGAGACAGVLPLGGDIAQEWADSDGYPFPDRRNLVRVAQYVAVEKGSPMTPKYRIADKFKGKGPPDFSNPTEPHRIVAQLRLPVYITTNYDDFMLRAIKYVDAQALAANPNSKLRQPRQALCKWHLARRRQPPPMELGFEPTEDEPVIFHMHGYLQDIGSMVLTEDDYLDFLMNISEVRDLIPARIEQAFTDSSLLFMGYSLEDMNFKVLFRKLVSYMQISQAERHVSVQLAPKESEPTEEEIRRARKQRDYLEKHFGLQNVKIYWGTCEEFTAELGRRWGAGK